MNAKLLQILGNGNGSHFGTCHVCHATSPGHTAPDDLKILALAKAAGWIAVRVESQYRLYCSRPKCQNQAK